MTCAFSALTGTVSRLPMSWENYVRRWQRLCRPASQEHLGV